MKFQCSFCGLRLNSLHFKQEGLMNPKLTSICDICLVRDIDPEKHKNKVAQDVAQMMLYGFLGKKTNSQLLEQTEYFVDSKVRKHYESFIQDYDNNEVALQQIKRKKFNQAIIDSESKKINYLPSTGTDFAVNMEELGLKVNFALDDVDFIDRERIRHKYNYHCQYCGRKGRSVDHKDPVSLSQNNSFDNLILSCNECNRIKSNMPFNLFMKLNNQLDIINKKLVNYENLLASLNEEFQQARSNLAGQVHLKGILNDPELNAMRKQNKKLHDALDSLQSDYDSLRSLRKSYFDTGWKLSLAEQNKEII